MKIITPDSITVEFTIDECEELVYLLGTQTGKISERTYDIYDKLTDLIGEPKYDN
jgi:hypothetical protein